MPKIANASDNKILKQGQKNVKRLYRVFPVFQPILIEVDTYGCVQVKIKVNGLVKIIQHLLMLFVYRLT